MTVHIHLVLPRAPQIPPTSATVRHQPPLELVTEPVEVTVEVTVEVPAKVNHTQPLRLRQAQASSPHISAYLTDGEKVYKQAIFTQEQLGLANQHAQDETEGVLYWEPQPTEQLDTANGVAFVPNAKGVARWQLHEEAILTNPAP